MGGRRNGPAGPGWEPQARRLPRTMAVNVDNRRGAAYRIAAANEHACVAPRKLEPWDSRLVVDALYRVRNTGCGLVR